MCLEWMEAISYGYSSISEIDNSIKNKWEEDYNLLPQTVKKGQHKLTLWEPPEGAASLRVKKRVLVKMPKSLLCPLIEVFREVFSKNGNFIKSL